MASLAPDISFGPQAKKPWRLPVQGLAVFHGCAQIIKLSHYFLPGALLAGRRVLYLDGANQFDPRLLIRLAQRRGCAPAEFNRRVRVARAFTCFQLAELLCRAPVLLRNFPAQVILVSALPELFFDQEVRETEALAAFQRALGAMKRLSAQTPVAVFSDAASHPSRRQRFFNQLTLQAGQVWRFEKQPDETLSITCEKAPAALRT